MSWDIALSEMETGDYSACVVLLIREETFFVLEVVRGRFPFETLKGKIMELKQRYQVSTLLIEESPISLGLIQSLRERSINVTTYKPDTDKRARLIAQTDLFAGGSVRLPQRAAWLEEFVAELLAFPGGHDDQVDALTQGLAWGRQAGVVGSQQELSLAFIEVATNIEKYSYLVELGEQKVQPAPEARKVSAAFLSLQQ